MLWRITLNQFKRKRNKNLQRRRWHLMVLWWRGSNPCLRESWACNLFRVLFFKRGLDYLLLETLHVTETTIHNHNISNLFYALQNQWKITPNHPNRLLKALNQMNELLLLFCFIRKSNLKSILNALFNLNYCQTRKSKRKKRPAMRSL